MKTKLTLKLLAICMAMPSVSSHAGVLHQITESFEVTRGATLIKEERLTEDGWVDLNLLRVDLDDSNIAIKPIGSDTVQDKQTLLEMTQNAGAVAAINADFFSLSSNVPSFGPMITEGELMQGYNNNRMQVGPNMDTGPMATMLMYDDDDVLFDYFYVVLEIHSEGRNIGEAISYNKVATFLTEPMVLDRRYLEKTDLIVELFPGSYTIVVEDEEVVYHSEQGEMVEIPRDGYVIMMNNANMTRLYSELPIGAEIELKQNIMLDNNILSPIEEVEMGIGGGGLIMKDGDAYEGPSNIVAGSSRNPRSIVATTYNPSELLLISIDGRGDSIGATHQEVITILEDYDAKDAMYLDGGGSTTLVAREAGEMDVTLQNQPSGGVMRNIMNGIGIFTERKTRDLDKLYIETTNERTFVGEPVAIALSGVDRNENPVVIDLEEVDYTVFGLEGVVEDHFFYAKEQGEAIIIAEIDGVQVAKEIIVAKEPTDLVIKPSILELEAGETKTIEVYGMDAEGYEIPISMEHLVWEGSDTIVSAEGNQVTAHITGTTTLQVGYKESDAVAKLSAVVGDRILRVQGFESYMPVWGGDTTTVTGSVEPSLDVKFEGEQAVKMTYTFGESDNKQVAYTIFDEPIMLANDVNAFNIWVNGEKQGDTLKIEVVDAENKKHYIKLSESIDFEGWKYLSATLTDHVAMPAQVTKLYTYAHQVPETRTSILYFDHVSVTRGERDRLGITVQDDYLLDPMYKKTLQEPVGDDYVVRVVGPTASKSLLLGEEMLSELSGYLLEHTDKILLASNQNSDLSLEDKVITYENSYKAETFNEIELITVGTIQGTMRQADASQWLKLKETLEETTANHIMINMSRDPLTSFTDKKEGEALHDYLVNYREETGKNIFVITPGHTQHEVKIEEGIRYMKTPGIIGPTDDIEYGSFLEFKVVDGRIYYTFMPMKKK